MTSRGRSATAAAAAAAKNRKDYLRLLRDSAREASLSSSRASAGAAAPASTTVPCSGNGSVGASSRIRSHEANLHLPEEWVKTSTARLQLSLEGIVLRETFLSSDLFLCALIHPSYVRLRSARERVAMPLELTLMGSATLRLLKEVAAVHGISGMLKKEEIASIPRRLGVENLVLYDKAMFKENCHQAPPEEVRMAAATALCGAVTLTAGMHSATTLLDGLRGPMKSNDGTEVVVGVVDERAGG